MILAKLVAAMALVIFMSNRKINLGIALAAGGIVLGLLAGRPPVLLAGVMSGAVISPLAVELALIILMITILGHVMKELEILERMVLGFEGVLRSSKLTILIIPAIMGSFAVTGGALLSCPVVDTLGEKLSLDTDKRAAINLIFRHIFGMFLFPFTASFIMATRLADISPGTFILMFLPIALFMLAMGYLLFLREAREPDRAPFRWVVYGRSIRELLLYASPIYVSLALALALGIPFYGALAIGVLLTMGIFKTLVENSPAYRARGGKPQSIGNLGRLIVRGVRPGMVLAVLGILAFKAVIEEIHEIPAVLQVLMDGGIPIEVVIVVFGWLMAFASSSTQGTIALLYPLILPLAGTEPLKQAYVLLIYMSGFLGYYISPLHMCQVLTLQYFDVKTKALYRNYRMILPATALFTLILYFIRKG